MKLVVASPTERIDELRRTSLTVSRIRRLVLSAGLSLGVVSVAGAQLPPIPEGLPGTMTSVTLTVVDGEGSPLPGVSVSATGPADRRLSARTDADGRLQLSDVPPGDYLIEASLDGFATVQIDFTATLSRTNSITLTLSGPIPEAIPDDNPNDQSNDNSDDTSDNHEAIEPASDAPAEGVAIRVLDKSFETEIDLERFVGEQARDGWTVESIVPLEPTRSLLILQRLVGDCTTKLVTSLLDQANLEERLQLNPKKRFAGVHLLPDHSYVLLLCNEKQP